MKASRALLLVAALAACETSIGPNSPDAALRLSANVSGTPISQLVVTVTAPDITTPLVFNIPVTNGTANGTLRLPPGSARTILVEAFDQTGAVTHDGSATINVHPGQNPPVSIPLRSRAGQVPIIVTIAEITVVVTPGAATIMVGGSLQLSAAILDANNQPLTGTVTWATTSPAFATVDQNGRVDGIAPGQVMIVAVHEGVAGTSNITVSPVGGSPGSLVITEFMANPSFVADASGEWLELFNPTNQPVNIEGWTLTDNGTDVHQINAGGNGLFIPPGGHLVLGNNSNSGTNGGIPVAYQYANFNLANGADEIVLRDVSGNDVDRIAYNATAGWPIVSGHSASLDLAFYDPASNDFGANWCPSVTPIFIFGPDTGTPGALNEGCPGTGQPMLQSLSPSQLTIFLGTQEFLTVTLSAPSPSPVTLDVAVNGTAVSSVPSVTIPAGLLTAPFPVTALLPGTADVTVTLNGISRTSTVTVP
jgi:lamin tail-like protein/Big-like domain-containing protein